MKINIFYVAYILISIGVCLLITAIPLKFGSFDVLIACLLNPKLAEGIIPNPYFVKVTLAGITIACIGIYFWHEAMIPKNNNKN